MFIHMFMCMFIHVLMHISEGEKTFKNINQSKNCHPVEAIEKKT